MKTISLWLTIFVSMINCRLATASDLVLRYDQPAEEWIEALPLGNGRLGAMVYGGPGRERIQFNEDTLWNGQPGPNHRPNAAESLPEIRSLLFEGRQQEAEGLAAQTFMGDPLVLAYYQSFGTLHLQCPGHQNATSYRRNLDLNHGLATVAYQVREINFTRQCFMSSPDQVLVWHMQADRPGQVYVNASLSSLHDQLSFASPAPNQLILQGQVRYGELTFAARLVVLSEGGQIRTTQDELRVSAADSVTILLDGHTSFKRYDDISGDPMARCEETLEQAQTFTYQTLLARHIRDYQSLFHRVSLDLGPSSPLPLPQRLTHAADTDDPQLAALLFQYGRYLLMAGSRPGSQPLTLMGIWNDSTGPPWGSRYVVNINLEMAYWPTEVCNLSECHEPLFGLIQDCVETGRDTARNHYDANGWVLHHTTDLWRCTAPANGSNHGIWPTGGAWLCHHLWEHYLFTGDRDFLAQEAYPIMKEASRFFAQTLIPHPQTHQLISSPSNSPEHGGLVAGPTMDHEIIDSLFDITCQAAEILDQDAPFVQRLRRLHAKLAPPPIGPQGDLLEWLQERDDVDHTHKFMSHLWGLYPGTVLLNQEEIRAAARQSLSLRGDIPANWSRAWKINLWARLKAGDKAYHYLQKIIEENTASNLMTLHPPFLIDGNLGLTAGIAEMLLQSHGAALEILPALPQAWPEGSVRGLCGRQGFEVDIAWSQGKATEIKIHSKLGRRCNISHLGDLNVLCDGRQIQTEDMGMTHSFATTAGQTYRIVPQEVD